MIFAPELLQSSCPKARIRRGKYALISALLPGLILLLQVVAFAQGEGDEQALSNPDTPQYEHLFNCLCEMEVVDGEVDASKNCGKPLANCSCGFSERMRDKLRKMDQRGLSRREQIEAFKEEYGQFGKKVLAVPDPANSNWILAYLVPPVVIILALLFVGGIGWYWLEDRIRSGADTEDDDEPLAQDEIEQEIEREIEQYRQS